MFTEDSFQNKLHGSGLGFTKCLNNAESNSYGQINAWTSGNINSLDLFKAPKEDDKKGFFRVEKPLKFPSTTGNITKSGNDTTFHVLCSEDEELINIFQTLEK